jgi:hypothetical protein
MDKDKVMETEDEVAITSSSNNNFVSLFVSQSIYF